MIGGKELKQIMISGSNILKKNKNRINELNVFPVPDGDTGNNMTNTMESAINEINNLNTNDISIMSKAISTGLLKGARGNSGVILSQFFNGFSKGFKDKKNATTKDMANALFLAKEEAYNSVLEPKEGTILTIAKAISDKAMEIYHKTDNVKDMMQDVLIHSNTVLDKTKDMLEELRNANVVDAGGSGLLCILQGFVQNEKSLKERDAKIIQSLTSTDIGIKDFMTKSINIKYLYCTEFFVDIDNSKVTCEKALNYFKKFLLTIGDSIVIASDDNFIKIHLHTNLPSMALGKALEFGEIYNIKIDNMKHQHNEFIGNTIKQQETKKYGIVFISNGDGITEVCKEYDIDEVICAYEKNPSVEEILNAINKVNAENIFVFVNNKNVILSANGAKKLTKDKNVIVINSKNIASAFCAITRFMPNLSTDENIDIINDTLKDAFIGELSFSIKDVKINNINVKKGDTLCIINGKIEDTSNNIFEGACKLIDEIVKKGEFLSNIIIYYGNNLQEKEIEKIENYILKNYIDLDIEIIYGGQKLYYYIICAE